MGLTYSAFKLIPIRDKAKKLLSVCVIETVTYDGSVNAGYVPSNPLPLFDLLAEQRFRIKKVVISATTWSTTSDSYLTSYYNDESLGDTEHFTLVQGERTSVPVTDMLRANKGDGTYLFKLTHGVTPTASDAITVNICLEVVP